MHNAPQPRNTDARLTGPVAVTARIPHRPQRTRTPMAGPSLAADRKRVRLGCDVWLLFCCQALIAVITVVQVMAGALVGHSLAANKALATLPSAVQMAATMAASVPACAVFERLGRRAGFLLGAAGSLAGCLLFAAGVWRADFALYCLGAVPTGLGFGVAQHLRFAAAEVAEPSSRPRAVALVMAGGVLAAAVAPSVVRHTKELAAPVLFLGTYLFLAALPVIAAVLLACADLPPPAARHLHARSTPIRRVVRRPDFIVAAAAGMAAYASMNLVMVSMPVQMTLCGFGVDDGAAVLGVHGVAMFAPGFATGRLIQRFGPERVVCAGGLLAIGCTALSLGSPAFLSFAGALALLGLGWNLMFTGATALLARAHDAGERLRAQAANDFLVFGAAACASFGSGMLQGTWGWLAVNLALVPPVLVVCLGLALRHRAARASSAMA